MSARRAGPAGRGAARAGGAAPGPGTGSPTSWPRPASRSRARRRRAPSAPGARWPARRAGPGPRPGPATTMSAAATSSGGVSSSATAMRTVRVPVEGQTVEGGEGGQVPGVVAGEARRRAARAPGARPPTPCRCRPEAGTRPPCDRAGGRARCARDHCAGEVPGPLAGLGSLAPVHGDRARPCPRSPPPSPANSRPGGRHHLGHRRPPRLGLGGAGAPCRPRSTRARRRRTAAPPGPPPPGARARNDTGRPETTATSGEAPGQGGEHPGRLGEGVGGGGVGDDGRQGPVEIGQHGAGGRVLEQGGQGSRAVMRSRATGPVSARRGVLGHGRGAPVSRAVRRRGVVDPRRQPGEIGTGDDDDVGPGRARHRGDRASAGWTVLDGSPSAAGHRRGRARRPRHRVDLGRRSPWWWRWSAVRVANPRGPEVACWPRRRGR